MNNACRLLIILLMGCALPQSYRNQDIAIASMAVFDPARYLGLWYEIASFPTPFQAGCRNTTATYTADAANRITISNRCEKPDRVVTIGGSAVVSGPGRLKVRLNGVPVTADYWVLWVDEGYRTAVVGVPSGRAGWILNRTPEISSDRLRAATDVLEFNGYDIKQLQMTQQENT